MDTIKKSTPKTYDFSWIDQELKKQRSLQEEGSFASQQSDVWVINQFTYPHNIFCYMMPERQGSWDGGGNNFLGDETNYLHQLEEYKKRFK